MKIPTDPRTVQPSSETTFKRPRSTIESEKYALQAAEKGYERQMAGYESDRIARTINFVGNLTQTAVQFADKLIENEAARQLSNAEVAIDQKFYDVKKDLADNPYEQQEVIGAGGIAPGAQGPQKLILRHEKVWGEAKTRIKDEVLKDLTNPRAKKVFETRYEKVAQDFGHELQNDARKIMRVQQKVDLNNNIQYWISKGKMNKVNELLSAGRVTGLYNPEEIDTIADNARSAIAYGITKSVASSLPFEQSMEFLNSPDAINKLLEKNGVSGADLTEEKRNEIIKELEDDLNNKLAKEEKAKKEYISKTNNDFVKKFATDYDLKELKKEVLASKLDPIGQGGKQWWIDKIAAKSKTDVNAIEANKKQIAYNAEYDRIKNVIDEVIESGETDKIDKTIDKINTSKLRECDQDIFNARIKNWGKGIEKDIRLDEYVIAGEKIKSGEITRISQITNSKDYEHLSIDDIKKLESSIKAKITADNPNYVNDLDKKAKLDRMILQGRKDDAQDFLNNNLGADKEGNPGISLKEAGKYQDDLNKEREAALKNATKEGIELIDNTFKNMIKVAENPKDKFDIETAQKRMVTKYREMITDDMEPDEIIQKAKKIIDEEQVANITKLLTDAHDSWMGKEKKTAKVMERVKTIGLNDNENKQFVEFMGEQPEKVARDEAGDLNYLYKDMVYKFVDGELKKYKGGKWRKVKQ